MTLARSRDEMIELLEALARSADRYTNSHTETASIAREAVEHLRVLPLMGVQRPEEWYRALVCIAQGANEIYPELPKDGIKPLSRYEMAYTARQALCALPHTGQRQEGPQRAPENCPNCIDETDCSHVPICRAVEGASPAPQAGCATEGWKYVYVKRWRTLIHVPQSIADEVRDALASPPPPVAEGGWQEPDYLYDPDDWEVTWEWSDRSEALDDADIRIGEVKQFNTLISGPPKFAAHVVLTRDDAGDPDDHEIQWFNTEEQARAAVPAPPHIAAVKS